MPLISKNLLIWGDTQVGKSTLIATAMFAAKEQLPGINHRSSAEALNAALFSQYRQLTACRWVSPTVRQPVEVNLFTRNGGILKIRDVPGSFTREVHEPEILGHVREAHAVLYVVEWNARDLGNQMDAIRGTWEMFGDRPRALALTKCERHLTHEDEAWDRGRGWWKTGQWQNHVDLLRAFGDAVFPTSAYGYHYETHFPAVILGEYGQLFPFGIQPRGVAQPLQYLIEEMGLA